MVVLTLLTAASFLLFALSTEAFTGEYKISGKNGVVIDGMSFTNPGGNCLTVRNSQNITVKNSTFTNCGNSGIAIMGAVSNIIIENNSLTDIGPPPNVDSRSGRGIHFNSLGKATSNVKIRNNIIRGPVHSSCIQFGDVHGPGHEVRGNRCINVGMNTKGFVPDLINMYGSSGTAGSPILIVGNYLKDNGDHSSACGSQNGDHNGAYITVMHNTLINTGGWGLCIAGGHHIAMESNLVFMEDAPWSPAGPNGVNIRGQSPDAVCHSMILRDNFVKAMPGAVLFKIHDGPSSPTQLRPEECGSVSGFSGSPRSVYAQFPGSHRHSTPEADTNCWNCSKVANVTVNSCLRQSNCPAGVTIVDLL